MSDAQWLWTACGGAVALAIVAGIADWRRTHRRRGFDDVGWVPWRGVQVAAVFTAVLLAALAARA